MNEILLSILVFSPLLAVVVLAFTPSNQEQSLKWIGLFGTLLPLVLAIITFCQFDIGSSAIQLNEKINWISFTIAHTDSNVTMPIQYELGVNGLSLVLILLTSVVAVLAAIGSFTIKGQWKSYFIFFLLMEVGMLGVFASQNLFLFFIFFEMTLIPMFFLIGRWGYENKEKAAYSFLIYNGLGSAILLIVFVVLFMKTGTLNYGELANIFANGGSGLLDSVPGETFRLSILIALLLAFGVKLPIVPLHTWMLRVHVEAPPPVVMIHSGILLKIGAYGLITFGMGFFPAEFKRIAFSIAILGVVNLLYGAFIAIVQTDVKKVLAYSSVSHMGIVLIGLAALNDAGVQGAIFQVVSHGLISALLFFLVGVLYERTGTSYLKAYSGFVKTMPLASGVLVAAGLASLGLPGMSGFISELMSFLGLFQTKPIVAAVGTLGIILTAVYMLRAVMAITFGPLSAEKGKLVDLNGREMVPAYVLLALIIAIGVYPDMLGMTIKSTLDSILSGFGG